MRINIYTEEQTQEVNLVTKKADTGNEFMGIRFMLKSSADLHNNPNDDDRSAVTFWVSGSRFRGFKSSLLAVCFRQAAALLESLPDKPTKK